MQASRTTSTKTRIETRTIHTDRRFSQNLPEQHPPKQGLKLLMISRRFPATHTLPEQHPPKQGLKHQKNNKLTSYVRLPEQHPPKQGLKPCPNPRTVSQNRLPEQHPPKQGLKQRPVTRAG